MMFVWLRRPNRDVDLKSKTRFASKQIKLEHGEDQIKDAGDFDENFDMSTFS